MPITPIGKDLYQISHVSGEIIKASASAIEMSCFLGQGKLKPILQMVGKPIPEVQGEKIVTANAKLSIAHFATSVNPFYNEFGGIDQIITLFSKPQSNTLIFDYDSTNLVPYLQPPLTPTEIAEGCIRPDHVVNSLAWYHTSKGGLVSPSDVSSRITTGKAQHWYRQLVIDALGNKSWADWIILNASQVGLVLDDKFMSTATYPIVIAPVGDTFGYTNKGASQDYLYSSRFRASKGIPTSSGDATSITWAGYAPSGPRSFKGVLVSSGLTILTNGVSTATVMGLIDDWYTSTYATSPSVVASTVYYVGIITNNSIVMDFDSVASSLDYPYDNSNDYTTPTNPTDAVASTVKLSVYCTYTPSGGGALTIDLSDAFNISDSLARDVGKIRTDSFSLFDLINKANSLNKSDSFGIVDTISKASNLIHTDTMDIADAEVKSMGLTKDDSVTIADDFTKVTDYVRAFDDLLTISDSISKAVGKPLSDAFTIADSIDMLRFLNIILADNVTIADALTKQIALNKADTVIIADALIKIFGMARTDASLIADSIAKGIGLNKVDNLAIADSLYKIIGIIKSELVTITDSISKGFHKVLSDSMPLADSFSKAASYARSVVDNLAITDSISKAFSKVRADTLLITDAMTALISGIVHVLNLFDTVVITDSISGLICVKTWVRQQVSRLNVQRLNVSRMAVQRMNVSRQALWRYICRRFP